MAVVSAADRLRAAILASVLPGSHGQLCGTSYGSECDCSIQDRVDATMERIWAADLTLEQDIADGQAIRLLREALPNEYLDFNVEGVRTRGLNGEPPDWDYEVLTFNAGGYGPTIAEAADACRKALEARS